MTSRDVLPLSRLPLMEFSKNLPQAEDDAMHAQVTILLLHPEDVQQVTDPNTQQTEPAINRSTSRVLCERILGIFMSPSHSFDVIFEQMVLLMTASFGISFSPRRSGTVSKSPQRGSRWYYVLEAICWDERIVVTQANIDFVLSAVRQGGWDWILTLVEAEQRWYGGVWSWESLETPGLPVRD